MALNETSTVWVDCEGPSETTELAWKMKIQGKEHWVPIGQIGARRRDKKTGEIVRVELTTWIANKLGLKLPKKAIVV